MSNDPRSRLQHATRPPAGTAKKYILDMANLNYQTIGMGASIIGAIETAIAAAAGSKASLASRVSIYLLPIAAFQFGTWLRERSDAKEKQRQDFFESTRRLILLLAIEHASELHMTKYPNSVLKDESSMLGFRLVTGRLSTENWTMTHKLWRTVLGRELETLNVRGKNWMYGGIAGPLYLEKLAKEEGWRSKYTIRPSNDSDLWKAYVLSRFDKISHDFSALLERAEKGM